MKTGIVRTAAVTSLVTAFAVSSFGYFVMPHLSWQSQPQPVQSQSQMLPASAEQGYTMNPAQYQTAQSPSLIYRPNAAPARGYESPAPRSYARATSVRESYPAASTQRDAYGEPVYRQPRSTEKSALIVGASAGTGAAIGAIAGGGKGAGIGALAGGAAGFIYDRLTAHPKN